MDFLRSLLIKLFGYEMPAQPPATSVQHVDDEPALPSPPLSTESVSDPEPGPETRYAFVLDRTLEDLQPAERWYWEPAQKKLIRSGSAKAFAWLSNFIPLEVAQLLNMPPIVELGPDAAPGMVKEIRGLIREQRKAKQPHAELLRALFGASVLADFTASLAFSGLPGRTIANYVSTGEIEDLPLDFMELGYRHNGSLGKTDVKWLVDEFGEPTQHQSLDTLHPDIRLNAISRYCWRSLREANEAALSAGEPQQTMLEWMSKLNEAKKRPAPKKKAAPVLAP